MTKQVRTIKSLKRICNEENNLFKNLTPMGICLDLNAQKIKVIEQMEKMEA